MHGATIRFILEEMFIDISNRCIRKTRSNGRGTKQGDWERRHLGTSGADVWGQLVTGDGRRTGITV